MTVLEDVAHYIGQISPRAVCDDCITEKLGLSVRQHANHKTRELAGSRGYARVKARCSVCGSDKLVIRRI